MEFYRREHGYRRNEEIVSIPNGMEFYARLSIRSVPSLRVSIPNGMEFYSRHLLSEPGSNAQFQFPTGWNSTERLRSSPAQIESFNSQRDGILPKLGGIEGGNFHRFQFPTGWNSTSIERTNIHAPAFVSIPNGMEFYEEVDELLLDSEDGFNSQRDGILHIYSDSLKISLFSFNSQRDGILRLF